MIILDQQVLCTNMMIKTLTVAKEIALSFESFWAETLIGTRNVNTLSISCT